VHALTILVAGASGFIGAHVSRALAADGHRIVTLSRPGGRRAGGDHVEWDPARGTIDQAALRQAAPHVVINLAGARIDQRWTPRHRDDIRDSRIDATRTLVGALSTLPTPPRALLNASAVGYYGAHRGDELLTEQSDGGEDFLARTAREWEDEATQASAAGVRVVLLRTGVVLGPGGALARLRTVFRAGIGGRIGNGRQWMSWIAHDELPHVFRHLIATDSVSGAVNVVAPVPVQNSTFTRVLARVMHRPAIVPVPAIVLEALFGQMARDTILASQRALPSALQQTGYTFRFASLEGALRHGIA